MYPEVQFQKYYYSPVSDRLIICCKILDMAFHWASVGAVMMVCCLLIRVVVLDPFLDEWCSKGYGEEYVYINA